MHNTNLKSFCGSMMIWTLGCVMMLEVKGAFKKPAYHDIASVNKTIAFTAHRIDVATLGR